MTRNTILLLGWNVLLTALVGWVLLRPHSATAPTPAADGTEAGEADVLAVMPSVVRDSAALKDARIAYFRMDSLQKRYELIKDKDVSFRSEGRRLENSIQQQLQRAQQRYAELMNKDHTYSTKEELQRDEAEVQQLAMQVQQLQAQGEEQLARLEARILQEISDELKSYLEEYNKSAGFDYIFSVQNGGQIWVGNEQLDITDDLVNGLNARYRAGKKPKP
jgi:outer membrane protein